MVDISYFTKLKYKTMGPLLVCVSQLVPMGYVVHILEMRPVYSSDRVEYVLDFVDGRYFVLQI